MDIKTKGITMFNGDTHVFIPPSPTQTERGGIKAKAKTTETVEIAIGTDDKLYAPSYPTSLPASDVSDWAKQDTKPTYTAGEVGALPGDTVIPFIVTVDKNGYADHTADEIIDAANNGKVCLLIHMGLGNSVYVYSNGNESAVSTAIFRRPVQLNNTCELFISNGKTKASVYSSSFEQTATKSSLGVIKIGDGLEEEPGSDGRIRVTWIMNSSTEGSTKKFKLTVDDSGTIKTVNTSDNTEVQLASVSDINELINAALNGIGVAEEGVY